jgi:hypothetical protein
MVHRSLLGVALFALTLPAAAAAQQLSSMAGRAEYDLSGVHTGNVWAVRLAVPVEPYFLVEPAVSYIHTRQDFARTDLVMPEIQLQAQVVIGAIAPYLGAGVGAAIDDPDDDPDDEFDDPPADVDFTSSVAAGFRLALARSLGLRAEGRLRGIATNWVGTVAEVTAGLVIAF